MVEDAVPAAATTPVQPVTASTPILRDGPVTSLIDETTSPRGELPLALRLRAAAGAGLDTPHPSTGPQPAIEDDALSLAVRLGLRPSGDSPHPSTQEIGPTS
nr:hypothetical protein [Naasia aerilata]